MEEDQHEAAASNTEWRSLHEEGPPHVKTTLGTESKIKCQKSKNKNFVELSYHPKV